MGTVTKSLWLFGISKDFGEIHLQSQYNGADNEQKVGLGLKGDILSCPNFRENLGTLVCCPADSRDRQGDRNGRVRSRALPRANQVPPQPIPEEGAWGREELHAGSWRGWTASLIGC